MECSAPKCKEKPKPGSNYCQTHRLKCPTCKQEAVQIRRLGRWVTKHREPDRYDGKSAMLCLACANRYSIRTPKWLWPTPIRSRQKSRVRGFY